MRDQERMTGRSSTWLSARLRTLLKALAEFVKAVPDRVKAGRRRTWPRLFRGLIRRCRQVCALVAALPAVVLLPALHAGAASPRWAFLCGGVAAWLTRRKTLLVAGAALLIGLVLPAGVLAVVLVLPGVTVGGVLLLRAVYPHTTRGRVRTRCGVEGWATWWDLRRHTSAHAVRHVAVDSRPSLARRISTPADGLDGQAARSARLIERLPITECGIWLGRSTVGPVVGTECYAAHRDVVGLIAPPQTGKTAVLGHHVLDHPGAVVSTSTKPDVYAHSAALRARKAMSGRVELFNPEKLAGIASTFRWSPVHGCHSPTVAAERAAALVGATSAAGGEDGTFWLDSAAKVLRCFLMAAALDGRSMGEVAGWVTNPSETAGQALTLLEQVHVALVPAGWAGELRQVLHTDARRTRESIFLTLSQSVSFMSDPEVAAICTPGPAEPVFDVDSFLADTGTLYILGSERPHASVAPLLAALTSYVFEAAKRLAAGRSAGRLDPPLMLALDEAALITPVPLDRWVADAGGRGIHIVWAVQSPSQLAQRWGREGANTVWNATNAKLIYGGLTLDADLEAVSRLCGERHEVVEDERWGKRLERMRVLPVDRLRTLPQWHALLLHRATPPTIVRLRPVWDRPDVRAAGESPPISPIGAVSPSDADAPTQPIAIDPLVIGRRGG